MKLASVSDPADVSAVAAIASLDLMQASARQPTGFRGSLLV